MENSENKVIIPLDEYLKQKNDILNMNEGKTRTYCRIYHKKMVIHTYEIFQDANDVIQLLKNEIKVQNDTVESLYNRIHQLENRSFIKVLIDSLCSVFKIN